MAATTRIFHLRPTPLPIAATHTLSPTPASVHFFSSSSSSPPDSNGNSTPEPPPQPQHQSRSPFTAFFNEIKANLKNSQKSPHVQQSPRDNAGEKIRRNLAEYRRRTAPPPPPLQPNTFDSISAPTNSSEQSSFVNVLSKSNEGQGPTTDGLQPNTFDSISAPTNSSEQMSFLNIFNKRNDASAGQGPTTDGPGSRFSLDFSMDGIRKRLQNMNLADRSNVSRTSLKWFPTNEFAKPSSTVIGGSGILPSLFEPEIRSKEDGDVSAKEMRWKFIKMYSSEELGRKLRLLRPEKKAGNNDWFSLEELNQRLVKLREMEENESASKKHSGLLHRELMQCVEKLQTEDATKPRQQFRLDALTNPGYMLSPPKEDLVEKYFHPDNMSASEKLKLDLNKVRDEFKMSESDCGSARVQVAQLTTKIKHLSEVLHPKDKHSRKGLQAMVEKRKKFLKYMRRTDWASYCFVLSKLGLRDNPGYKH